VTNEDRGADDGCAAFNIFAARAAWPTIRLVLTLGEPDERNDDSISWNFEGLTLSIIVPEEQDEHEPAGPDAATDFSEYDDPAGNDPGGW